MPVCTNRANLTGWGMAQRAGIPHHSTILLFHHSAPNKPNLPISDCGLGTYVRRDARSCETKPIWTGIRFRGSGVSDRIPGPRSRDLGFRAKQTQFLREWNDMQMLLRKEVMKDPASQRRRKNKANFGVTGETPVVLMGETPMLRNPWRRLPACAGMTLLRTRLLRQTNPICGRAERRISAVWIRSCDECDTGEAVKKQSQFGQAGGRQGRRRAKTCKTNPIWAGGAGIGATERAKLTQFDTAPPRNRVEWHQTKPVSARQADPMDLESASVCRPHPGGLPIEQSDS